MANSFGKKLRQLRESYQLNGKKLSGEKLAEILGISQGFISAMERGDKMPGRELTSKIAQFFNVTVDYLICETDTPTPPNAAQPSVIDVPSSRGDTLRVPILSREKSACCGPGFPNSSEIYADYNDSLDMPSALVGVVSVNPDERPYFIYADGDSMIKAGIMDSFLALVNPAEPVYDGDSALVEYGINGNIAIKRVYWLADGAVRISSADDTGWTRTFTREEINGQGLFRIRGKIMFAGLRPKRG